MSGTVTIYQWGRLLPWLRTITSRREAYRTPLDRDAIIARWKWKLKQAFAGATWT